MQYYVLCVVLNSSCQDFKKHITDVIKIYKYTFQSVTEAKKWNLDVPSKVALKNIKNVSLEHFLLWLGNYIQVCWYTASTNCDVKVYG